MICRTQTVAEKGYDMLPGVFGGADSMWKDHPQKEERVDILLVLQDPLEVHQRNGCRALLQLGLRED